jgi:hypothetical protein
LIEVAGDHAGYSVQLADMNADGLDDVLVNAPSADEGATYVAFAPFEEGELSLEHADARVEGPYHSFSFAVGDSDGDGIADFMTGSAGGASSAEPEVLLFTGPIAGDLTREDAIWRLSSAPPETSGDWLGEAQDMADLDGDGVDELIVGVPSFSGPGVVDVYSGTVRGETGFPGRGGEALARLQGVTALEDTGSGVSHGDLDGDGIADLLIPWSSSEGVGVRAVYSPVSGTIDLEDADAVWDLTPENGVALVTTGDVDADGAVEVMIGVPSESTNAPRAGAVFVMPGTPGPHTSADAWATYLGMGEAEHAGTSLATGDFDHDSAVDLAVGADYLGSSEASSGSGGIYMVYQTLAGTHDLAEGSGTLWTGSPLDYLGCSLASGDADGAGGADLLVGATMSAGNTTRSGAAYLTFGL